MRVSPSLLSLRILGAAAGALALAACSSSGPEGEIYGDIRALSDFKAGIATYYDATGEGNCSYDASPNDMDVAAIDTPEFNNSAICGACAEVDGPQGTVTVRIVDSCPTCQGSHLDLSRQAFSKIAPIIDGRVQTQWRLVSCVVQGPVRYRFKEGSNANWVALQVRNHRLPIQKLELQKGGSWVDVKRESYNYFVIGDSKGFPAGPLKVRITATDGQKLEDTLPEIKAEKTYDGAAQFSLQ
jgi:expansin (peptidoglycan-binding protein)